MTLVVQPPARPGGSTGTSHARRCVSRGALRVARGPLLLTTGTASHRARGDHDRGHALDPNPKQKHHPADPQGLRHLAGFKSERWPASSRNGWPASYWNAWPASSEYAMEPLRNAGRPSCIERTPDCAHSAQARLCAPSRLQGTQARRSI